MCDIQGKVYKDDSFDGEDEEEEILPDPSPENLSTIAKEIGTSPLMHNKMVKIQEHVLNDRVLFLSNL